MGNVREHDQQMQQVVAITLALRSITDRHDGRELELLFAPLQIEIILKRCNVSARVVCHLFHLCVSDFQRISL